MKICIKCKAPKAEDSFYFVKSETRRVNKCKECTKEAVRENYKNNRSHYLIYEKNRRNLPHRTEARRAYGATDAGLASGSKAKGKWISANAVKRAAHIAVRSAMLCGKLTKSPCEVCGSTSRIHGHHDDYGKPLDVRWLCSAHHSEEHRRMRSISGEVGHVPRSKAMNNRKGVSNVV